MITLHTWNTPKGQKPAIQLEELGLDYETKLVHIQNGGQNDAGFRALNPNGKIPAIDDSDVTVFESGAILLHLAETHGRFLSQAGQAGVDVLAGRRFRSDDWSVGSLSDGRRKAALRD